MGVSTVFSVLKNVADVAASVAPTPKNIGKALGFIPDDTPDAIIDADKKKAMPTDFPKPAALSNTYIDQLASGAHHANVIHAYKDSLNLISNVQEFKAHLNRRSNDLANAKIGDFTLKDLKIELKSDLSVQMQVLNSQIDDMNRFLAANKSTNNIDGLLGTLHEFKANALDAMKKQQEVDLKQFKTTVESLTADTLKLEDPTKLAGVQKKAIEAFKSSQEKSLKTFENDMDQKLALSHLEAQMERDRVALLHTLYTNSKEMRRVIEALYERNLKKEKEAPLQITLNPNKNNSSAKFANIDVQDIPIITTLTGRKIKQAQAGEFFMELPNQWLGASYYASSRQNMLSDLTVMAMAIRASGYPAIQFTIDDNNPKTALAAARATYEACRLAGYKDEDIHITFKASYTDENGKKSTKQQRFEVTTTKDKDGVEKKENPFQEPGKLFASGSGEYKAIQERANTYDKAGKAEKAPTPSALSAKSMAEFKASLNEFKNTEDMTTTKKAEEATEKSLGEASAGTRI